MTEKQRYLIEGMDCADCALNIERGVGKLDGVNAVQVNLAFILDHPVRHLADVQLHLQKLPV